jgi:hypothetical protein
VANPAADDQRPPDSDLKIENDRIVMPDATKASPEGMPEYRYTNA